MGVVSRKQAVCIQAGNIMKIILQYSLAGKLLCTHKGLRKAALAAGANRTTIMKACQAAEKLLPKAGYFWRYANKPFTEEELTEIRRLWEKTDRTHLKDQRTTEVLQYSLSGELIGKYKSITAAAEAVGGASCRSKITTAQLI